MQRYKIVVQTRLLDFIPLNFMVFLQFGGWTGRIPFEPNSNNAGTADGQFHFMGEGAWSVVTIRDNAGGIPEEIIERISEPYFTTKESGEEAGIGLPMSKNIIERRSISVRNEVEGAVFRIEI